MSEILVHVIRGEEIEGCHHGDLVVVDWQNNILKQVGDPNRLTYWRSGAKPFQLLPLLENGAIERFGFTKEEIAMMVSSHGGEEEHVRLIEKILQKIGCQEDELDCGFAPPLHSKTASEILRRGEEYTKFHHNCSGKHTGMLALIKLMGLSTKNYISQEHPIQKLMLSNIAHCLEIPENQVKVATDGCGVPVFGCPIRQMALAYAKLTVPEKAFIGEKAKAARIVQEAMTTQPFYVAGTGRIDTALMEVTGGRILAKLGAEAVYNVGIKDQGIGVCLKIDDGSFRAIDPVIVKLLNDMGFLTKKEFSLLEKFYRPLLKNHRGEIIGYLEAVF